MSCEFKLYVPCLRWKQGEYQALFRLSSDTKDMITPLIEIPEIGYDFENATESTTIDEHLSQFAKRVNDKWHNRYCLVDIHNVGVLNLLETGQHPLAFVFDDLRLKGALAIPVIDLDQDMAYQDEISRIVSIDKRGLCIRINVEEAANAKLKSLLDTLLQNMRVSPKDSDFILDLKSPNFEPVDTFARILAGFIARLPYLKVWRSFALIGTSFPKSMAEVEKGLSIIPRSEWQLYKLLVKHLHDAQTRIPRFGDYAINHPEIISLDMRKVKPSASVRYTIDDGYLINKGANVRDFGFTQYNRLCRTVVESGYYCGESLSAGDKYIGDCAHGNASTGTLTTWRWVGTNHHLEKVVRDIANFSV